MSLKFLAKKSWHTTNLKNVEKVWIAEEKAAQESKKVAELQKQILEERQIQELRQLQAASGMAVKNLDTTMDWMYEGPSAQQQQSAEEFLLGKIYKPSSEGSGSPAIPSNVPLSSSRAPSVAAAVFSKNEAFTRLHEDPMLAIRQQEKSARESVLNNPVKMARIRHQLAAEIAAHEQDGEEGGDKKHRKHKKSKKQKKDKKDRRSDRKEGARKRSHSRSDRGRSSSRNSSSDESRSVSRIGRSWSRSNEGRNGGSRAAERKRRRSSSASPTDGSHRGSGGDADAGRRDTRESYSRRSRGGSRSRSRSYARDRDRKYRESDRSSRRRSVSRSRSRDGHRGSRYSNHRERSDSRDHDLSRPSGSRGYSSGHRGSRREGDKTNRSPDRERRGERGGDLASSDQATDARKEREREQGYGLIKKNESSSSSYSGAGEKLLGPQPELLRQRAHAEEEKANWRKNLGRNNASALSEEEKARRVQEMLEDASTHEKLKQTRTRLPPDSSRTGSGASVSITGGGTGEGRSEDSTPKGPNFLSAMRTEVFQEESSIGIEERLKRNRYYQQKPADFEQGFMKMS